MDKAVKFVVVNENDYLIVISENNPKSKIIITVEDNSLCVSEEN